MGQDNATFVNSTVQAGYVQFKSNIDTQIANMSRRPAFDGGNYTIDVGDTRTVTDSSGVFADYVSIDFTVDGIRFQHTKGSNDLIITVTEACTLENYRLTDAISLAHGFIKDGTQDYDTTVYFQFRSGEQDQLYSYNYNDPVPVKIELTINQFRKIGTN